MGDTSTDTSGLSRNVEQEAHGAATTLEVAMRRLFERDQMTAPGPASDGSYPIE